MRTLAARLLLAVLMAATLSAMLPPPPGFVDLYNEDYNPNIGYRLNTGWVIDTDGNLRPDVAAKSEGIPITVWPRANSTITYSWRTTDSLLHRVDVTPIGELSDTIDPIFKDQRPGHTNYYYPHTAPDGAEGVLSFSMVEYANVYPNIDVILYSGSGGAKMAWVVRPGGDPDNILMQFQGQDSLKVDDISGVLRAYMDSTELLLPYVIAYQWDGNNNVDTVGWEATFRESTSGDMISFDYGTYDTNEPLVFLIGAPPAAGGGGGVPGLDWSTSLGLGSVPMLGNNGNFFINAGTSGTDGDLYTAGNTEDDLFPDITGSQTYVAGWDMVFGGYEYDPGNSANDASQKYLTYLGGSGHDKPIVIEYTNAGELFAGGWTSSSDMPMNPLSDPQDGSYYQDQLYGTHDGFIVKLDNVTGEATRTSYFGGAGKEMITAITERLNGDIFLSGATTSPTGTYAQNCASPYNAFPMCNPPGNDYQQFTNAGGTDAFVVRLNAAFALEHSTMFGGPGNDEIYDAAYRKGPVGIQYDLIVLVGRTSGELPDDSTGVFQLGAAPGDTSGVISTFSGEGELRWGTNVHGVDFLQGVVMRDSSLVVIGSAETLQPTTLTCNADTGMLSICDPGGNAYVEDSVIWRDQYYAEYNNYTGAMLWSTVHGSGDCSAPNSEINVYQTWNLHPFPIHRFMDLEFDNQGNFYGLGIYEEAYQYPFGYTTLPAYGYYNNTWDPNTGNDQTDVTLTCFLADRSRYWSSNYGSMFEHVNDPFDANFVQWGCDFGGDLVLAQGKALYWVGSTGGHLLPLACPYPGTSYCEDAISLYNAGDFFQGFMARMSLDSLNIGIAENGQGADQTIFCYPNPATDELTLFGPAITRSGLRVLICNTLGQIIISQPLQANGRVPLLGLSPGLYLAVVERTTGERVGVTRFMVR